MCELLPMFDFMKLSSPADVLGHPFFSSLRRVVLYSFPPKGNGSFVRLVENNTRRKR